MARLEVSVHVAWCMAVSLTVYKLKDSNLGFCVVFRYGESGLGECQSE